MYLLLYLTTAIKVNIYFLFLLFLFNDADGHVLHLRPESVGIRERAIVLDDESEMESGEKCGLNFHTVVLMLREIPGKYPQSGN